MNYAQRFRVSPGTAVKLQDIDPRFKNHHEGHKEAGKDIEHYQQRLRELQELLYADGRQSLLICLQALDAGGKDGTINHILGSMNPQGCKVVGFKQPSAEELCARFPVANSSCRAGPGSSDHLQPVTLRGRLDRSRS